MFRIRCVRTTARLVDVHKESVMRLGLLVGELRREMNERIERVVPRLDGGEALVEHVDRLALAGADGRRDIDLILINILPRPIVK